MHADGRAPACGLRGARIPASHAVSGEPWAAHVGDDVGAVRDPERAPAKRVVKVPRERGVAHARRAVREHALDALGQLRARLPQRRCKHHRQRAPQRMACPDNAAVVLQGPGIRVWEPNACLTASAPPSKWPVQCTAVCVRVEEIFVALRKPLKPLKPQRTADSTVDGDSNVAACVLPQGLPLSKAAQIPLHKLEFQSATL